MKKHEPIDEAGPQRSREGMHMAMCPEGRGRKQQGEVRYRLCSIWNDKMRKNSLFENKSWIMSNTWAREYNLFSFIGQVFVEHYKVLHIIQVLEIQEWMYQKHVFSLKQIIIVGGSDWIQRSWEKNKPCWGVITIINVGNQDDKNKGTWYWLKSKKGLNNSYVGLNDNTRFPNTVL